MQRTLRDLRKVTPKGMRAMRSLTTSTDIGTRVAAIERVGSEGYAMASDEIVKALGDPSPKVRRNAARALARLGDARLANPPDNPHQRAPGFDRRGDGGGAWRHRKPLRRAYPEGPPQEPPFPSSSSRVKGTRAIGRPGRYRSLDFGQPRRSATLTFGRASIQALRILEAREAGLRDL